MQEFLPIGTVVLLKEATRKVLIIGFAQVEENSKKIWDYIGCAYPVGVISNNTSLLFDKEQIDKVISLGYSDNEDKAFRKDLQTNLSRIKRRTQVNGIDKL